jgi:hypothetical protein
MSWISSPKVRLALIVNGLYFVSHFVAPSPPHARPQFFAQARESLAERAQRRARAGNIPLPPPYAPSRATADESGGVLQVSLKKDLTLVRSPGRTLVLSPSFSVSKSLSGEPGPSSVLLHFIIYANEEACPGDCPLTIAADNKVVWPDYRRTDLPGYSQGWTRKLIPHSSTESTGGQLIETMAAESLSMRISYEQFLDTISARRVIIKLGPDRVELTPDQIEALRDMHRSLPLPPPSD